MGLDSSGHVFGCSLRVCISVYVLVYMYCLIALVYIGIALNDKAKRGISECANLKVD